MTLGHSSWAIWSPQNQYLPINFHSVQWPHAAFTFSATREKSVIRLYLKILKNLYQFQKHTTTDINLSSPTRCMFHGYHLDVKPFHFLLGEMQYALHTKKKWFTFNFPLRNWHLRAATILIVHSSVFPEMRSRSLQFHPLSCVFLEHDTGSHRR